MSKEPESAQLARQFIESIPARQAFPINRTETIELLAACLDFAGRENGGGQGEKYNNPATERPAIQSDAGMPQSPAPMHAQKFWREYYKDDPNFPPSQAACEFAEAYAASLRGELEAARQQLKDSSLDSFLGDSPCGHRKQFMRVTVDAQDVPDGGSECLQCQNAALVAENTRLKEALQKLAHGDFKSDEDYHAALDEADAVLSSKAPQETK